MIYDGNDILTPQTEEGITEVKWIKKVDRENAVKADGKGFNLRGTLVPISKNLRLIQFINKNFNTDLFNLVK